jgi:hypothetical protein
MITKRRRASRVAIRVRKAGTDPALLLPNSLREASEDEPLAIRTLRNLDELESVRSFWESRTGTRDSDFDFYCARVRARGLGCRPHVIVLSRKGRPEAILIGLHQNKKLRFRLGFVTVCQPVTSAFEFVYGGLCGDASVPNCELFIREILRSLYEGEADLARWERLNVQSPLYEAALRVPPFTMRDHSGCHEEHWFRHFPKGLDAFFNSLGRKQRSKLRREYNKVLNCFPGKASIRSFRAVGDLELAIPEMEKIARKTEKRQLGFGFYDTAETRAQLAAAAEAGWLRIYILYLEDKPAAFWAGTVYRQCLQGEYAGYDSRWSKCAPGTYLFLNILEQLREEDVKTIDFDCGSNRFNRRFGSLRQFAADIQIYAPTLRGMSLSFLRTITYRSDALMRRVGSLEPSRRALWHYIARRNGQHTSDARLGEAGGSRNHKARLFHQ